MAKCNQLTSLPFKGLMKCFSGSQMSITDCSYIDHANSEVMWYNVVSF